MVVWAWIHVCILLLLGLATHYRSSWLYTEISTKTILINQTNASRRQYHWFFLQQYWYIIGYTKLIIDVSLPLGYSNWCDLNCFPSKYVRLWLLHHLFIWWELACHCIFLLILLILYWSYMYSIRNFNWQKFSLLFV